MPRTCKLYKHITETAPIWVSHVVIMIMYCNEA